MKTVTVSLKKAFVVGMILSTAGYAAAEMHDDPATAAKLAQKQQLVDQTVAEVLAQMQNIGAQGPALRTDLGEHVIDGEPEAIAQATTDVIKTVMNRAYVGTTPGIAKGDHGKTLSCLSGTIEFLGADKIPAHLQRGVVVPGARYEVLARLSNAEEPSRIDRSSTSQGVALKLKNVSKVLTSQNRSEQDRLPDFPNTDEQDFLMTSAPTFFVSNIVEYAAAFGLRNGESGATDFIKALAKHPRLVERLGTELGAKLRTASASAPGAPTNIVKGTFWSKHPYAWGTSEEGSKAVKYSVEACENSSDLKATSKTEDFQKRFISDALDLNKQICFYLRVQTRPDGVTEQDFPIEDGNIEWQTDKAPFVRIAKIILPKKGNEFWHMPEEQAACGKTEFTPWNGLMAHQPMSNLARGRRLVYKASALVREKKDQLDPAIESVKPAAQ